MGWPQAYCLYRLGRLQEALAALSGVPPSQAEAKLQLEAQVGARAGMHTVECTQHARDRRCALRTARTTAAFMLCPDPNCLAQMAASTRP
jgi:hypothetical protein